MAEKKGCGPVPVPRDPLIENVPLGYALCRVVPGAGAQTDDGMIERANPAFFEITGYPPGSVEGARLAGFDPDTAGEFLRGCSGVRVPGERARFEMYFPQSRRYCEINAWCPEEGFFSVFLTDLTRSRSMERALIESEQRYHFAIEALDDAVWDINREKNLVYWSPRYYTMLGYRPGEILPSLPQLLALIHPRDRVVAQESLDRCQSGEADQFFETLRFLCRNGEVRWIEMKGRVMKRDSDGTALRFVGTNRDVHHLTEARIRIREQEDLFRTIFEQAMVGIAVLDSRGGFIRVNHRFCDISGYTEPELAALRYTDLATGDMTAERSYIREVLKGERDTFVMEKQLRHKSGRDKWLLFYARVLRTPAGEVDRIIAIVSDITSRREAEQALLESRTRLEEQNREYHRINEELAAAILRAEESDRLKTAFLANMSHEIRTPLNGILGFAELLVLEGISDGEKQDFIRVITESGHQLLGILNDIIDVARIETGQLDLRTGPVKLDEVMEELYRFYLPVARKKGVGLRLESAREENTVIPGDYLRLKQITGNLLGNAVKFTTRGEVSFGYRIGSGRVSVSVCDTGPGIPREKVDLIFERFRQLAPAEGSVVAGNGLGLAICRAYVTAMGGTIGVRPRKTGGSEFFFEIPYCKTGSGDGE